MADWRRVGIRGRRIGCRLRHERRPGARQRRRDRERPAPGSVRPRAADQLRHFERRVRGPPRPRDRKPPATIRSTPPTSTPTARARTRRVSTPTISWCGSRRWNISSRPPPAIADTTAFGLDRRVYKRSVVGVRIYGVPESARALEGILPSHQRRLPSARPQRRIHDREVKYDYLRLTARRPSARHSGGAGYRISSRRFDPLRAPDRRGAMRHPPRWR
jgi:hypothetical protein